MQKIIHKTAGLNNLTIAARMERNMLMGKRKKKVALGKSGKHQTLPGHLVQENGRYFSKFPKFFQHIGKPTVVVPAACRFLRLVSHETFMTGRTLETFPYSQVLLPATIP